MSGKARLLLTGGQELPEKVERELHKIVEQCDRVSRLTRGLLDYCRPSINPKAPMDVHEPLAKALALVRSKATRRGIEVREDLPACEAEGSTSQGGRPSGIFVGFLADRYSYTNNTSRRATVAYPAIKSPIDPLF